MKPPIKIPFRSPEVSSPPPEDDDPHEEGRVRLSAPGTKFPHETEVVTSVKEEHEENFWPLGLKARIVFPSR